MPALRGVVNAWTATRHAPAYRDMKGIMSTHSQEDATSMQESPGALPARRPRKYRDPLLYLLVAAAGLTLASPSLYKEAMALLDYESAYSGRVIKCGANWLPSRRGTRTYVVLRHSDGSTEKRYVQSGEFHRITVGDSIVKRSGLSEHINVVRPN